MQKFFQPLLGVNNSTKNPARRAGFILQKLIGQRHFASDVSIVATVSNLLAVLTLATVFATGTVASAKTANPNVALAN